MAKNTFAAWIENKYLAWQVTQGERKSIESFAEYLGTKKTTLIQWMNDQRKPGPDNVELLAVRLGMEVYDVLGLERPDEELIKLKALWPYMNDRERAQLGKILKDAEARAEVERQNLPVPKRSR